MMAKKERAQHSLEAQNLTELLDILVMLRDTLRDERSAITQMASTIHLMRERLNATQQDNLALAARLVKVETQIAALNKKLNMQAKKPAKARKQSKLTRK